MPGVATNTLIYIAMSMAVLVSSKNHTVQWRKKMFWSGGAENHREWYSSMAGIARHNLGGSGGMLPQENLDFYISLDRFWCILRAHWLTNTRIFLH